MRPNVYAFGFTGLYAVYKAADNPRASVTPSSKRRSIMLNKLLEFVGVRNKPRKFTFTNVSMADIEKAGEKLAAMRAAAEEGKHTALTENVTAQESVHKEKPSKSAKAKSTKHKSKR
jgi:hypothetical protein